MALISCPDCKASISDKAPYCIKCGCPIAAANTGTKPETANYTPGGISAFYYTFDLLPPSSGQTNLTCSVLRFYRDGTVVEANWGGPYPRCTIRLETDLILRESFWKYVGESEPAGNSRNPEDWCNSFWDANRYQRIDKGTYARSGNSIRMLRHDVTGMEYGLNAELGGGMLNVDYGEGRQVRYQHVNPQFAVEEARKYVKIYSTQGDIERKKLAMGFTAADQGQKFVAMYDRDLKEWRGKLDCLLEE